MMFIMPFLVKDKPLNKKMKNIFKLYMLLYEPKNNDWRYRKLISFSLYKGLPILVLATFNGQTPIIKKDVDFKKLKTIIDMKDYREWFFEGIKENWLREKWYSDNKLPIVCELKNDLIVIDGNHRFAQQIYHNEIKYSFIKIKDGWFKLYIKYILLNKEK